MFPDDAAIATGVMDFIGKILIPLIGIPCATIVALFTIHRADQRERDKQRRDDLRKAAMDFFTMGARAEDSMIRVIGAAKRGIEQAKAAQIKVKDEFFDLCNGLEALDTLLVLVGEENLGPRLVDYHQQAMRCEEYVSTYVISSPVNACIAVQEIEAAHKKRRECALAFAAELERLRLAGRQSLIARLFDRFPRL